MEEKLTMDDYATELEASLRKVQEGDVLTGTVIGVSDTEVTVDLKSYTDGIIRAEDYSEDPSFSIKNDVHVGDEVTATVLRTDDGQGHLLLSRKAAADDVAWKKLQQYLEEKTVKEIQVQVITVEPEKKRLVLSARELLREKAAEERRAKISNVQVGLVTEGKVESIQPYGAFIDLGDGLSGLVHVSQISDKRIKTPDAVLKVGDTVKVKVIAIKDGKLSLSMKALKDVAAEEVREEKVVLPKSEELTTNLGELFKNIKLD